MCASLTQGAHSVKPGLEYFTAPPRIPPTSAPFSPISPAPVSRCPPSSPTRRCNRWAITIVSSARMASLSFQSPCGLPTRFFLFVFVLFLPAVRGAEKWPWSTAPCQSIGPSPSPSRIFFPANATSSHSQEFTVRTQPPGWVVSAFGSFHTTGGLWFGSGAAQHSRVTDDNDSNGHDNDDG